MWVESIECEMTKKGKNFEPAKNIISDEDKKLGFLPKREAFSDTDGRGVALCATLDSKINASWGSPFLGHPIA